MLFTLKPRGGTMQNEKIMVINFKIAKSTLQNSQYSQIFAKKFGHIKKK